MREDDGRKLDHQTLEALRLRSVERVARGADPRGVSVAFGLHKHTVYGWVATAREHGREALRAKPIPGRPQKLTEEQTRRVYEVVVGKDPRQLQFDFALWTRDIVREFIRREFKVSLSASAVGRLLHRLGLSPQRPLWRAWQSDPDKVAAWKDSEYPKIAKAARRAGGTVYFADEAGVRSDHHAGTTWGAIGRTPIVKTTGARFSLNMISAVTAQGLLRFSTFNGSLTADKFIEFCKRLMADTAGPVFLVVDGHPVHRAKKVTAFAASSGGKLRLFQLPGYSPQLNPDEWVWKNIKHDPASAGPGSPGPTSSRTWPSPRCAACRPCRTSCVASSATPTWPTSALSDSTY